MAVLTVQTGESKGLTPVYAAAAVGGDSFINKSQAVIKVRNTNTGLVVVTIPAQQTCSQGYTHPLAVNVPPNESTPTEIGPLAYQYQTSTASVSITYSLSSAAPTTSHVLIIGAAGLPNGVYRTQVTFVNASGESIGGPEVDITVVNQQISWQAIPIGPTGTTSRKLYRTSAGGAVGTEKLVTTIADNTTTTFTDNVADGSLGAAIPTAVIGNVTVAVVGP